MSFTSDSERKIAYKKLLGKAQTDNLKDPANEAISSFVQGSAGILFGEAINASPSIAALYDITAGNVERVRLTLAADPSANGHAFIASLPLDYEANSSNPKAGTGAFVDGQVLSGSFGALQIVHPLYGLNYEAKPYRGGTGAGASGALVPPGDAVDWALDYANGVIFQEDDPAIGPADMDYLECLIYIGDMTSELLAGAASDIPLQEGGNTDLDTAVQEVISQVAQADAKTVKWIITATNFGGTKSKSCEVLASSVGAVAEHNVTGVIEVGSPSATFLALEVDVNASTLRLLGTVDEDNVIVDVTEVLVRA